MTKDPKTIRLQTISSSVVECLTEPERNPDLISLGLMFGAEIFLF